jgi:hypothetical protein
MRAEWESMRGWRAQSVICNLQSAISLGNYGYLRRGGLLIQYRWDSYKESKRCYVLVTWLEGNTWLRSC